MGITDEERRGAAERLRELAASAGCNWPALSAAVLGRAGTRGETLRALADMVDAGDDAAAWLADLQGRVLDCARRFYLDTYRKDSDELLGEIADKSVTLESYKGALNAVCRELGMTDGTGTPMLPELIVGEIRRRLMPEGVEWPRYEDDRPVMFGDELEHKDQGHIFPVETFEFMPDGWRACSQRDGVRDVYRPGERVERPAPKVYDADGVEIREGDTVWYVDPPRDCDMVESRTVTKVEWRTDREDANVYFTNGCYASAKSLTHRAPVRAADGLPLREGETVYGIGREESEYLVRDLCGRGTGLGRFSVLCRNVTDGEDCFCDPSQITHERPDSWGRLEEDAELLRREIALNMGDYSPSDFEEKGDGVQDRVLDLVRRARALAGVSE